MITSSNITNQQLIELRAFSRSKLVFAVASACDRVLAGVSEHNSLQDRRDRITCAAAYVELLAPRPLSPAKMMPYRGGDVSWGRLVRTAAGVHLETAGDERIRRLDPDGWEWAGDLTATLEAELTDDDNHDLVARVLGKAIDQIVGGAQ